MSETVTITGITGHDAGMTGHIDRNRCRIPESGCGDDARRPGQLPWQSQYQGLQLLLADLQMGLIAGRPSEQALVETTGCQPDAHAIMHQNLEPVGATVGKDVGVMRVGCAEDANDANQHRIHAGTHVGWLHGQPDGIDADHASTCLTQAAESCAWLIGQWMESSVPPRLSSMRSPGSALARSVHDWWLPGARGVAAFAAEADDDEASISGTK